MKQDCLLSFAMIPISRMENAEEVLTMRTKKRETVSKYADFSFFFQDVSLKMTQMIGWYFYLLELLRAWMSSLHLIAM